MRSEDKIAQDHYLRGFAWAAGTVAKLKTWAEYEGQTYTSRDALREYALGASQSVAECPDGSFAAGLEAGYYSAMGLEP